MRSRTEPVAAGASDGAAEEDDVDGAEVDAVAVEGEGSAKEDLRELA